MSAQDAPVARADPGLDPRFRGLERKAGLFLGFAALLALALVAAALVRQGLFTQTSPLYFFAPGAQGIAKGMAVQLSGFRIGSVEALSLEADTSVKVRVSVESDTLRHITQGSAIKLAREGLIGASFLEIVPGERGARPHAAGGVLRFERERDFGAIADSLAARLNPILEDVKRITERAQDPQGDLLTTLRHIRETTAAIAAMRGDLQRMAQTTGERIDGMAGKVEQVLDGTALVLDKAGRTIDTASQSLASATRSLETLGNTLRTVNRELPALVLKIDHTLANVESASADARRIAQTLGSELPPAIREGRMLTEDAREIVDGARRAWPIRNLLPAPEQAVPPLDSHEPAPAPR